MKNVTRVITLFHALFCWLCSLSISTCFAFVLKKEVLLELLLKNGNKNFKEAQASSCSSSGRNATEKVLKRIEESADNLDESLQLPGPSSGTIPGFNSDKDEDFDDANYTGFTKEDAKLCYEDWLSTLHREDTQMMAMMIYDNYIERFGLLKTAAAKEVGPLLGINEKTIRTWKAEFCSKGGCL